MFERDQCRGSLTVDFALKFGPQRSCVKSKSDTALGLDLLLDRLYKILETVEKAKTCRCQEPML